METRVEKQVSVDRQTNYFLCDPIGPTFSLSSDVSTLTAVTVTTLYSMRATKSDTIRTQPSSHLPSHVVIPIVETVKED